MNVTIANPAQAMAAGANYFAQLRDVQRQGQVQNLFATQGAGIMAGDQNALAAYAALDPQGAMQAQSNALGMQQTRQSMELDAERLAQLRADAKLQAQDRAAALSAAERAAEAEKTSRIITGAAGMYSAGDKAGYEAFLKGQGLDPAQYPFEQFPAYAAMADGALEALKTFDAMKPKPIDPTDGAPAGMMWVKPGDPSAGVTPIPGTSTGPDWRDATPEEAGRYGAQFGQINSRTGEFKANNPPSNGITITNPDGTTTQIGGPAGGGGGKLTEAEAKNSGFLIRMRDSGKILDELEGQGTDFVANMKAKDPTGVMNYTQTPEYQQYTQAKRDFINALLRRESGAVIGPDEFASAEQQYFPQPGEDATVIEQKRRNRANAIAGVEVGAGAGASNPIVTGTSPASPPASGGGTVLKFDAQGNLIP